MLENESRKIKREYGGRTHIPDLDSYLSLKIKNDQNDKLSLLSRKTGASKSLIVRQILSDYFRINGVKVPEFTEE